MVWSKSDLVAKKYPGTPHSEHYMMFKLEEIKIGEALYGGVYDVTKMSCYSSFHGSANPFDTIIAELLRCVVGENGEAR